jgi:hypothetical protein
MDELPAVQADESSALGALQSEIESFIGSLDHPVLLEDDVELFDLTAADWRLVLEYRKLVFEAWDSERSLVRRVEGIESREAGRIQVMARRQGGRSPSRLEFRERDWTREGERHRAPVDRRQFGCDLVRMLEAEFPGWRLERVSQRSDREHSFSVWYTRGFARQGSTAWAFLGLAEGEALGAADSMLAFGLIWLDWLRARSDRLMVQGLKLFLPHHAVEATAHRAAYLDSHAVSVEIFEWNQNRRDPSHDTGQASQVRRIDLKDYGNVETRLVPHRQREMVASRHRDLVRNLLGDLSSHIDVVADAAAAFLSLRVLGLEVARIEGEALPRVYAGLEGVPRDRRKLEVEDWPEFREFLARVVGVRRADSDEPNHDFYRLQGERWLESLLVRDLTRIDPAFSPDYVYPQVPAFSGSSSFAMHRGVIDILGVLRSDPAGARNRLAVVELKLYEEINLPLQGLDYWLRVKWLHERGQFKQFGYFPGVELAPAPPLVYLVSPAFRFHSTTHRMMRNLSPEVEVVQVGINNQWRRGVKVLFRRVLKGRSEISANP